MAETRAHINRRIRQDELRKQLAARGHDQHVSDIVEELLKPTDESKYSKDDLPRLKLVIDTKLALMKKYMPDVKQVEIDLYTPEGFNVTTMSDKELRDIIAGRKE